MKIGQITFAGYAAAGNTVILNDINGNLVWKAVGETSLKDQNSFKIGWVQGLIPQQIQGGGTVILYIE
jgi:hypothetical protein